MRNFYHADALSVEIMIANSVPLCVEMLLRNLITGGDGDEREDLKEKSDGHNA
jgi:hypothetical protein